MLSILCAWEVVCVHEADASQMFFLLADWLCDAGPSFDENWPIGENLHLVKASVEYVQSHCLALGLEDFWITVLRKKPTTQASLQWFAFLPGQSHTNSRAFLDHAVNFSDKSVSSEIMKK